MIGRTAEKNPFGFLLLRRREGELCSFRLRLIPSLCTCVFRTCVRVVYSIAAASFVRVDVCVCVCVWMSVSDRLRAYGATYLK